MHVCLIVADQHVNVEGYSIADAVPMKGGQEIMSLDVDDITVVLHVQVRVPTLQSRYGHSVTAFSLSPGLTEVILFGGWSGLSYIAETTVLRFG